MATFYSQAFDTFAFADPANPLENDHTSQEVTVIGNTGNGAPTLFCRTTNKETLAYGFARINAIRARFYVTQKVTNENHASGFVYMFAPTEAFNQNTLTFRNMPGYMDLLTFPEQTFQRGVHYSDEYLVDGYDVSAANCMRFGSAFYFLLRSVVVGTPASVDAPALEISTETGTEVRYEIPTWEDGYAGKTIAKTAGQDIVIDGLSASPDGVCWRMDELTITGLSAIWRAKGSNAEYELVMTPPEHEAGAAGFPLALTFPAGTFGSSLSVEIKPKITTNETAVWSPDGWLTINLSDATPSAAPVSPVGELIDPAQAVTFLWRHVISSGTAQTKAELDYSTDGSTWKSLAVVTGAQTSYTAPANTFPVGVNFWRVRTYNADGVASEWSQTAQFICVGAPETPVVLIGSSSPRPTITWQVEGQLAYQVELEGVYTSGVCYGTGKQWTAPMYLADGSYTARVRVQNEYGLWSGWGTAALGVQNTAGAAITLNVESGASAELWWQTSGAYDFYLVYRDGALIAKTTNRMYTDLTSIGAVSYQVRGCFRENSNYGLSGAVQTNVNVEFITVIDLERSRTLVLPYSASAHRKTSRSFGRNVKSVQLAGRRFPTLERSEHESRSIRVKCAVNTAEERTQIEALVGALVAVKTPEGAMVTGCLDALSASDDGGFYTEYSFTVEQADIEEAVDIDA